MIRRSIPISALACPTNLDERDAIGAQLGSEVAVDAVVNRGVGAPRRVLK